MENKTDENGIIKQINDTQILYFLSQARYATTNQLARLFFVDSARFETAIRRANFALQV